MSTFRTTFFFPIIAVLSVTIGSSAIIAADQESTSRDVKFDNSIAEMYPGLVETRRDIHAHPELSNEEARTAALVANRLRELGMKVTTGVAKHGVIALLQGKESGRCVAIRADMDALPITQLSSVPYRSQTPGVMHACGHDVHTTVALGLARLLAKHPEEVRGTVKFIFQPAEEGMPVSFKEDWGARLMVAEGAMENPRPDAIFALHCRPSYSAADSNDENTRFLNAGQLGYTIGPDSANSDTFEITIKGTMAHGSTPHRGVDAIVVAAEAITALQTIRSRRTNTRQPLVLSIGVIEGGQRHNIIADSVRLAGTIRTYDENFRDSVVEMMKQILGGITSAHGATYELNYRKGYPSVINNEALVRATLPSLQRIVGAENVIEMVPGMGGEDFSFFSQVSPGFYFRLGVANESKGITGEIHTPAFDVDEECLKTGVAALAAAVCDFLKVPE
ncbi:MAG: amidohydrolase [Verrucomicrobiales bacterium]|nr:amidohydrolase [Verrucomicrobiales bacterium]HQW29071.1 amidohydrolase [Verrucomicrobiales bacterium]